MSTTQNIDTEQPRKRNMWPFWILLLVTGLPFFGSWIYYVNQDLLPMPETSNRGQLIQPVLPLGALPLQDIEGRNFNLKELQGSWVLLTVAGSDCSEECQRNLYLMRQTRLAMGEDRNQVNRLLVLSDTDTLPIIREQLVNYQGTRIAVGPADSVEKLLAKLAADGRTVDDAVFIIDKQGDLMMFYAAGYEPKALIKDLQRLFKVLRVG